VSSRLTDLDQQVSAQPDFISPTWRAYLALTKPRIIELLLVTTIPTMFLAAGGFPSWTLVCWTLLGGTLAAGGANVLNCYLDRDIDALMQRTAHRPSATGQISGKNTVIFGILLSILSVITLSVTVNYLSAGLAVIAIAFYVIGYTMLLKRRTSQNIVWGGAAGCMPVLIGWSAVTESLSWTPVILFLIVFFWTPPHYWPLSLRYKDDYAAAGIPMLPVEQAPATVAKQIILYSWAMVGITLLLIPVANMNWFYIVSAVIFGAVFLYEAYALQARVRKEKADLKPMKLFHWSISYLSLIFLAIGIDPFLN
jgi:protoheme IX farnesyltransferase